MKKVILSFCLLLIIGNVVAAQPRCIECEIAQIQFQNETRRMINTLSRGDITSLSEELNRSRTNSGEGSGDRSLNSGEGEIDSQFHRQ